jgi:hypothetical protein
MRFEPTSPTTATLGDNEPIHTLPEQVKVMVGMHKLAHDCVKATQKHMQESANQHRLQVHFTIGDKVHLKAANLRFIQQPCSKLRDRYIGPYLITEKVSPVAFRLKLLPYSTDPRCCTRPFIEEVEFSHTTSRQCVTNSDCARREAI